VGVQDHLIAWLVGVLAGCAVTVAVAIATRVRLLPEVVDISLVPTGAGIGSLISAAIGALLRFSPERLGRVTLLGTLLGAGTTVYIVCALALDVLS
jgi:hypothetical protein